MSVFLVDIEAFGKSPYSGKLTEFGVINYDRFSREIQDTSIQEVMKLADKHNNSLAYRGILLDLEPDPTNPASRKRVPVDQDTYLDTNGFVMKEFANWLSLNSHGAPIFLSDNNGYDYQWINFAFDMALLDNPFGHSSRRITDFFNGLKKNFRLQTHHWKRLRKPVPHDHNPVHDSLGNAWAFYQMQKEI